MFQSPIAGMVFAMEGFVHLRKTGMMSAFIAMGCISSCVVARHFLPDIYMSLAEGIDRFLLENDQPPQLQNDILFDSGHIPWFLLAFPTGIVWGLLGLVLTNLCAW